MGATMLRDRVAKAIYTFLFLAVVAQAASALLFVLLIAQATAGETTAGDVAVKLSQSKIVLDKDGKETAGSADLSLPGDLIEYKAVYSNKSERPIKGLMAVLPVPIGMQFTGKTTPAGPYQASVDGKTFDKAPLMREVRQPDGKMKKVPVPLSEYRALKLPLGELKAKESKAITSRMQISPLIAPQQTAAP